MKNIIIYLIIIFLLIFSISLSLNNNKKYKNIKSSNMNNYSYYKKENKRRYIKYKKNHHHLNDKDIIIRVNLNLDKKPYTNISKSKYLNKDYILINKYNYIDSNYIPNNLVNLDNSYSRKGMMLTKNASINLDKMIKSANKDNIKIRVISSYRSYYYQLSLYQKYVKQDGRNLADTYSARPGFSEHQTGLCIDVDDEVLQYTDFHKTKSYKWMLNNSYKYGFIERYPKNKSGITGYNYEAWHFRYVGKKISYYIKKHNITFDEYYAMFIDNN